VKSTTVEFAIAEHDAEHPAVCEFWDTVQQVGATCNVQNKDGLALVFVQLTGDGAEQLAAAGHAVCTAKIAYPCRVREE
jgi:hypothetical protein